MLNTDVKIYINKKKNLQKKMPKQKNKTLKKLRLSLITIPILKMKKLRQRKVTYPRSSS